MTASNDAGATKMSINVATLTPVGGECLPAHAHVCVCASAYEKGLPGLPGKSLAIGLKIALDSKSVGA